MTPLNTLGIPVSRGVVVMSCSYEGLNVLKQFVIQTNNCTTYIVIIFYIP